jgi:surface polysaccharide O-acyltransferase-like enzyme
MVQTRKYIVGFDILKILMAFVIISLHTGVSKEMGQPFAAWCLNFQNLAVPVFFVLSSYLFFDKFFASGEDNPKALWRYERRLLILYLIWSVIMIPITLFLHHYEARGLLGLLYWVKDFFFDYTFYASWFFGALIVGMPIVFSLRNHPWIIIALSLVLYVVFTFYALLPQWAVSPFELYHQHLGTPSRSFMFGIIWIGLGYAMAKLRVLYIEKIGSYEKMGGGDSGVGINHFLYFKTATDYRCTVFDWIFLYNRGEQNEYQDLGFLPKM